MDVYTHQSYSGFVGGGSTLYGPFAASHPTFISASEVQNVGTGTADITSGYFYRSGGQVPGAGRTVRGVVRGGVVLFYVPAEGVPSDFLGSVRITRSGSAIAGIHNVSRQPEQNDHGASYNLVQR